MTVRVRRLGPDPLTVRIPVGTYFVSRNPAAQNMVTTAPAEVTLLADEWVSIEVDAACANRPRDVPESGDRFTVQRSPRQADLARLVPVLDSAAVPFAVRQAAIWIVTDNADYGDLGILVSQIPGVSFGGSRVINEYEAAKAMQLCDRAGIALRAKAIWRDRREILQGLQDEELKRLLSSLN